MSGSSDNIFARWSRRKQAVRDSETPPPDAENPVVEAAAPQADAGPVEAQPAEVEPEVGDNAEPLPLLEDLTAESDLSAFLRKGVPKALKSAAIRKMWSIDPAIRDYIGPSEYAWDFNQPGAMAGFGSLDASESVESIADFLSTMSGGARAGFVKAMAASETSPPPQQTDATLPARNADASPDSSDGVLTDAVSHEEPLETPQIPANAEPQSPARTAAAAEPDGSPAPAESSRIPAAPRHGRAMPR